MTPLLDRIARTLAAASTDSEAEVRFARDALLRRGFAGALALSTLGHLVGSPRATAAPCPRGSLDNCVDATYRNFRAALANTCDKEPSFARKFECLRDSHIEQRDERRICERRCPKPKPKRPSSSKPTKTTRKAPQPPPLPPNPYDDGGLCASCAQVLGVCCFGGPLPGGFCACATPGTPCQVYGCP